MAYNPIKKAVIPDTGATPKKATPPGPVKSQLFTDLQSVADRAIKKRAAAKTASGTPRPPAGSVEKHFGLIADVSHPLRKDNDSSPTEVRPPHELTAGHLPSAGRYRGEKSGIDSKTGKHIDPAHQEPKKKKLEGPKLGVCKGCNGREGLHYLKPSGLTKKDSEITADDIGHPRSPAGVSSVGSKPTKPSHTSAAGTPRANQPPTRSDTASFYSRGSKGAYVSKKQEPWKPNVETKPVDDSVSRNDMIFVLESFLEDMPDFLEGLLHVDWETHKKTGGIFKFDPAKSKFARTKFAPVEPVKTNDLPPGTAPEEKTQLQNDISKAAANLGVLGGKRVNPKPTGLAAAKKSLFGESTMNPDKIANAIIREAFTSGDRNNVTPDSNGLDDKGGTARQMLAGEWFGSVAWPFDQPSNSDFAKSNQLQADQSVSGQGELVTGGAMESVATEIVDSLLEDSPSSIYSDPDSVGYLLNEMCESGYCAEADELKSICACAKEEDVTRVVEMIEKLEADKADAFLIEKLAAFASLLVEDDSAKSDDEVPAEADAEKVDTGKDTGGSGL
jgi:hypothetical protein